MALPQQLEYIDLAGELPAQSRFGPSDNVRLTSVTANYDGSAASGSFLPALALYSQDGKLIGRWFPSQTLASGDSGEVTFGPFLGRSASSAPPASGSIVYWGVSGGGATSVPTGTTTPLKLFGTGHAVGGTYIALPTLATPLALTIEAAGVYYLRGQALFASPGASTLNLEVYGSSSYPPVYGWDYDGPMLSAIDIAPNRLLYISEWMDIESSAAFPMYMSVQVSQNSGAAMNVTGQLYISRIGDSAQ